MKFRLKFDFQIHYFYDGYRLFVPLGSFRKSCAFDITGPPWFLSGHFYALSAWGMFRRKYGPFARASDASFAFVLLNAAAVVTFANFVADQPAWGR